MGINTTVPTVISGAVYPAATYNTYLAGLFNGLQSAWTTWTPTAASGLTLGNGTLTGAYSQVGKTITANFTFTAGSTSTVGVVLWQFPIAINTRYALISNVGSGSVIDSSVGSASRTPTSLTVNSTATAGVGSFFFSTITGQQNATTPFTWAIGDIMSGTLVYEAA